MQNKLNPILRLLQPKDLMIFFEEENLSVFLRNIFTLHRTYFTLRSFVNLCVHREYKGHTSLIL